MATITESGTDLDHVRSQVDRLVGAHPVVVDNRYTRWFAAGAETRGEVRHLTVQFSVFSHLYRLHAPTDWIAVEGPAAHHAFDTRRLTADSQLWPTPILANAQVSIGWQRVPPGGHEELLRDADGDQLCFVHDGRGLLRTEYGPLRYGAGDHLVIPRGTTYRFEPEAATQLLVVEAFDSAFRLPDRGLLGRHALFDPAVLEVPEAEAVEEGMLTWHPVGLHHGPQPGARARDAAAAAVAPTSGHRRMADEVAVMIDARRLLAPSHP